jgi:alpha-1,6-mannosyltransferase
VGNARYLILCGTLFLLLWAHSWGDAWLGDFWIYTATVAEVAASPLHPRHPLFGNDYAFAFLSPYTWILGVASRLSGSKAFDVLVLQGLANLALLLWSLHAFVGAWLRRPQAAFYALLFILLLWGPEPWLFSGFLHLRSLALVLPYPSTFAFAIALGTLAAFPRLATAGRRAWIVLVLPVMTVLWIVHPVNGLFLAMGLAAASLRAPQPRGHWVTLGIVVAASIGLAFTWPLLSIADLWFGQLDRVHEGNDTMYNSPLPRVAPALLGAPWLLARLRRDRRDPLALLTLVLGGLVFFGGLSGHWTLGRLVSHTVILLQIALADACASFEEGPGRRFATLRHMLAPALAALLISISWSSRVKPTLEEAWRGDTAWLGFLEGRLDHYDIVLTDLETCWYVPTFNGKVVAYPMQLPFVPDHAARQRDVIRFFELDTDPDERCDIIQRWSARHVLLDRSRFPDRQAHLLESLRPLGQVTYSSREYVLLRLGPSCRETPP